MTLGGGHLLRSRAGTQIPAIGLNITLKADGETTQDAYSLFEYAIPAGVSGPPPHQHTREDESFIILAGRLEVLRGSETITVEYGDWIWLPRNVTHTFTNPFEEEARVISVVSPAGLEKYYQALSELPPGKRDLEKMKAIMAEHGLIIQAPPAAAPAAPATTGSATPAEAGPEPAAVAR
jgi:mannose-6-phosphate isomerase-like protein (cupin superfamily)